MMTEPSLFPSIVLCMTLLNFAECLLRRKGERVDSPPFLGEQQAQVRFA